MGTTEDKNLKRSFESTFSLGRILGTISPASPPGDGVEKRALLDIDLNVAPMEDGGEEIRPDNDGIVSHWSKGEGICDGGEKGTKIVGVEKDTKISGWNTLLEVAKHALLEHEHNRRIKGAEFRNPSHESELSPELTRKKTRRIFAAETAAAPVVVRSTRGRALAMPNKYKDSVLDAAEAELPRGKSAAVASTKRKSR